MEAAAPTPGASERSLLVSSQGEEVTEAEGAASSAEELDHNPLLRPTLTGDVAGLQEIFENPEHPQNQQAMRFLLAEDVVGRNLLYAACMAGQSDVIRALAKYGVNLNQTTARGYTLLHCAAAWGRLETLKALVELDADIEARNYLEESARDVAARYSQTECVEFLEWADARLTLKRYIAKVFAGVTDTEKGQPKLFKEDKNAILNACRLKSEWLHTHLQASIGEIHEQRQQLEGLVTPIYTRMAQARQVRSAKSVN